MPHAVSKFDVHTHVGVDQGFYLAGWWPYACTASELVRQMDANGVDRAVCFPFCLSSAFDEYAFAEQGMVALKPGRIPYDRENLLLIEEIDRLSLQDRLLPFSMFDPSRNVPQQVRLLESHVERIRGLKTQTTVLQSPVKALLDAGCELMRLAETHDLPVVVHTAINPQDRWAQVSDCLEVARRFPAVRFNLAHSLRFHVEFLHQAASLPNVWVDCSAHLVHCQLAVENSPAVAPAEKRVDADYRQPAQVLEAVHDVLGDRYLWGSDFPFCSWQDGQVSGIYSYSDETALFIQLNDSTRRAMLQGSPQAWLFG